MIGEYTDSTVRKAARFAVYDDDMINVKNHQIEATARVDGALCSNENFKVIDKIKPSTYFGAISDPCCNSAPIVNHNEFLKVNLWIGLNS